MRTFKEQLRETWKVFQGNWKNFLVVFVINTFFMILCCIPLGLNMSRMGITSTTPPEEVLKLINNTQFLSLLTFTLLLVFIVYILCITASFILANGERSWKTAFKKSFARFWKMYFMVLFGLFLACLGFCLLIIPGILVLFFLSFIFPIAIIEDTSIIQTMKRSYFVIKSNSKLVFSRLALFALVTIGIGIITKALHLSTLDSAVSIIFMPIFYVILYKEIKQKNS